jgi:hypothetical protein
MSSILRPDCNSANADAPYYAYKKSHNTPCNAVQFLIGTLLLKKKKQEKLTGLSVSFSCGEGNLPDF